MKHDKCNRAICIMNRDIVTYYSTAICIYLHGLYAKKRAEVMINRLLLMKILAFPERSLHILINVYF